MNGLKKLMVENEALFATLVSELEGKDAITEGLYETGEDNSELSV